MKKAVVRYPCALCGNPEGHPFIYYTAKKLGSSVSVQRGVYRDTTTRTTTYANVTRHEGYVCKACRTKGRWRGFFILLAVSAVCWGLVALLGNDFLSKHGFLGLLLVLGGLFSALALIPALSPASGSTMLVNHYKQRGNPQGLTYLTPAEASRLQRK